MYIADGYGNRRVLIVDAAKAEKGPIRSADFLVAAFAGEDASQAKRATRRAAGKVAEEALKAADVAFWIGSDAGPSGEALERWLLAGGAVIWMPADAGPPPVDLGRLLGAEFGPAEDLPSGGTLDPGGYTSRLVGAFEGGSGGDLRRPVFKRRLQVRPGVAATEVAFMDGQPAAVSIAKGNGRAVALAFGPGRDWGDLATRPEFVVLAHSLAEGVVDRPTAREMNLIVGRRSDRTPLGTLALRPPGNHSTAAVSAGPGMPELALPFSTNVDVEETADLAPKPDRVKEAFAPDRVRVADMSKDAPRGTGAGGGPRELAAGLAVALALVMALECLVAGRMAARVSWHVGRGVPRH